MAQRVCTCDLTRRSSKTYFAVNQNRFQISSVALMGTTNSVLISNVTTYASDSTHPNLYPRMAAQIALANSSDIRRNHPDYPSIDGKACINMQNHASVAGQSIFVDYALDLEEILPRELWGIILSFCEAKQLAFHVPLICKYIYTLCTEDCAVWKEKSIAKFNLTVEEILSLDTTWKRFYHCGSMKLFPLFGCTIGKSTLEDLQKAPKVKLHSSTFLSLDRMSCWIENGFFSELYLIRSINRIPQNWESAVGISWHGSFNEYRVLLKRWTGNYIVTLKPHQQASHHNEFFAAKISSVSKEFNVFYEISFEFGPVRGSVDSHYTLNNIRVKLPKHAVQREEFAHRYRAQMIVE